MIYDVETDGHLNLGDILLIHADGSRELVRKTTKKTEVKANDDRSNRIAADGLDLNKVKPNGQIMLLA